ncbi:MAG: tyrosine-type recombinase/integrase [Butyrivibrio sp.]|uniref:site-specific tyrosine recombinase/integron integrase n=1 Tax=Butyrivibrio sp. TaxID=28121 RepID=UPI001B0BACE6|nr:site-specific tyrosine recombinase/integron integrase [Butyrivibrio sp.]MBO6242675.1 tyrosine-type recombinase/integrase [Butyrivibrio sp.]
MNEEAVNAILRRMADYLDNSQMIKLKIVLEEALQKDGIISDKSSQELLEMFLSNKRLEGRSEKTLALYRFNIEKMLSKSEKNVCVMNTDDIRKYLSEYWEQNGACKATVDNVRRNLSSFFTWLEDENYIFKSPLRRIHKIKTSVVVKDTYDDEDIEKLRDDCKVLRNLAIIDFLNSTGIRVGELVHLDIDDVDFEERECVVLGKGDKERVVYFDAKAKIHLKKYLDSRTDNEPALFVSTKSPHARLQAGGVESMLRKMGIVSNVNHVHPHKFRRTMATTAIDRGMPVEQVQQLLGHEKIDTTMQYAMVKQSNVKSAHKKYLG